MFCIELRKQYLHEPFKVSATPRSQMVMSLQLYMNRIQTKTTLAIHFLLTLIPITHTAFIYCHGTVKAINI